MEEERAPYSQEQRDFSSRSFRQVPSVPTQTPIRNKRPTPMNDRGELVRTRKQLKEVGPKFSGKVKEI